MFNYSNLVIILAVSLLGACATKAPKFGNVEVLKKNEEFDKRVQIVMTEDPGALQSASTTTTLPILPPASVSNDIIKKLDEKNKNEIIKIANQDTKVKSKKTKSAKSSKDQNENPEATNKKLNKPLDNLNESAGMAAASTSTTSTTMPVLRHEPFEVEGEKGFNGRRPLVDPFRVGEKVIHSVRYFKVQAGTLMLEVRPFAFVNGKKSYNFTTSIKSSSFFSSFYSVDDYATTLVDYDSFTPSVYTMHVKESGQLREARALFDATTLKATFWDKKQTEKDGVQEKRVEWDMHSFSQNVYSAAYYMRVFNWDVGVENAFRIAHDGDNLIFKGKAVRREKISTKVGEFNALVIKPDIYLKGKFTPTGDIYIWISDDDRKYILRIESEIKIGTLVSEIEELHKGY